MKKKLLFSFMLSILCILIFGAVNASAATYGDLTYEISNGEVIITDCDTSASGEFVIPSTIGIYPVTSIADCAFEECKKITSITIPNTITYIGKDAFYYCTNIKRVNITNIEDWCNIDFVTAYSNPLAYGYNLYQNDELVTDLVIPDSITNIGRHTFLACQSLTNVTIHDAVTNIDMRAFYACGNLTNITIPDSVIIIRAFAFAHCIKLSTVTIGNSVTNIYNSAFYDCDNLSTVYYNGSEQDWNGISIYSGNDALTEATKYFKYTYKFVDENGNVISENTVDYGTTITMPDAQPQKPATQQYTYTFAGWDGYTDGMTIEKDITFTAKYNATINKYTYKFIDDNGSLISEKTADYGTKIVAPSIPSKPATQKYTYTFAGWDGYTDGMTIKDDITFKAKYNAIINMYTYKFLDAYGNIIGQNTVDYGTVIIVPTSKPIKQATQQYTYTFAGWKGYTNGMTIEKDITFTPNYTSVINKYTYKFVDENGSLISEKTADYGTVITPPANPTKPNNAQYTYTFVGWDGYIDGMTIEKDVTFTAKYTATINKYTYKFLDKNGNLISEKTADYGTVLATPTAPSDKDPYTFDYWEGYADGMMLTNDITFTAVYKYKNYAINVAGLAADIVVTYNDTYTIPTQSKTDYTFMGYYTDKDGKGTKITDEYGNGLNVYNTIGNLTVYPYFISVYMNKMIISGNTASEPGDTIAQRTIFATDKNSSYLAVTIKYPISLSLKKITAIDFEEVSIEEEEERGNYHYLHLLAIYNYNSNTVPANVKMTPFELLFTVAKDAEIGNVEISLENVCLIGDSDINIENVTNSIVTINPKLAESISITGSNTIDKPTPYTATITPSYTSNKDVEWSIDNENIATISTEGMLTPVKNGTVTITATTKDGSGLYATKYINVIAYAKIDTLTIDNGTLLTGFDPDVREYTVYVDEDATSITLTPVFTGGVLRPNGSGLWISARSKTFDLLENETIITLDRENAENMTDCKYTINVIKYTGTKTSVTENGKEFTVYPVNIEENCTVVLAVYNGTTLTDIKSREYTGEPVEFTTEAIYTEVKIMLWDGKPGLRPVCKAEILK